MTAMAINIFFYLFCASLALSSASTQIVDKKLHFTIEDKSPYSLIRGQFHVRDLAVGGGEAYTEVAVGNILRFGENGKLNFRLANSKSSQVASWFNKQCDTSVCTTFGQEAGALYFATLGLLRLTLSFKHNATKKHEILLHDILIAEGQSLVNNWWFGGKNCFSISRNRVECKASTIDNNHFNLSFRRGDNSRNTVHIENVKFLTWMNNLEDDKLLSQINIPATHDSATYKYRDAFAGYWVKTQDQSIREQLQSGIRFLDIRCRHVNDVFTIHHDLVYVNVNFGDVLNQCISFLKSNPSESIVMLVKEEHSPQGNSRAFHETFLSYVNKTSEYWYRGSTIPKLRDVRGKIVLMHRFHFAGELHFGVDASSWSDNAKFSSWHRDFTLEVQDRYNVAYDEKRKAIREMLQLSKQKKLQHWYLNYISLAGSVATIYQTSRNLNALIQDVVNDEQPTFLGTVLMDYPNNQDSLTLDIVYSNSDLQIISICC